MIGYTDPDGSTIIRISIEGVRSARDGFEAMVDTGFTGFVSMPLMEAFPLGLILHNVEHVVFADGREQERLTALGTVRMGEASREGVIYLEPASGEILVGIEFLREFRFSLLLDPFTNFVQLLEEATTKRIIEIIRPES